MRTRLELLQSKLAHMEATLPSEIVELATSDLGVVTARLSEQDLKKVRLFRDLSHQLVLAQVS